MYLVFPYFNIYIIIRFFVSELFAVISVQDCFKFSSVVNVHIAQCNCQECTKSTDFFFFLQTIEYSLSCWILQDEYDSYMSYLLDTQKPSQHKVLYHHIDSLSENPSSSDKLKEEKKRVEVLEKEARHLLDENARYIMVKWVVEWQCCHIAWTYIYGSLSVKKVLLTSRTLDSRRLEPSDVGGPG